MSTKTPKPAPSPRTQRFKTAIIITIPLIFVIAVGFAMGWYIHKPAPEQAVFQPTRDNSPAPSPAPEGMVWIPAGSFWMGCDDPRMPDARPIHAVALDGYWMDATPVTNAQYSKFVDATHYLTVAEKTPNPKDYPGIPAGQLVPGACVFSPPRSQVALNDISKWWRFAAGASWRHPDGPDSDINSPPSRLDHPVTQLAYEDAEAYATWAHKRLPTEAEYEYAARGGLDRNKYAWGNEFKPGGHWMANIYQGHFPDHNTAEDGYAGTSPVRAFPANGFGLYDTGGNVWQWCSDWYRPDTYATYAETGQLTKNPTGPSASHDPQEPEIKKRVTRGGSFLCSDQYCVRFLVGSRGKTAIDTGTANVGFRCVKGK